MELESRRKAEILEAAALEFARAGFANTEVQVIADRLGIGKGTIYRYFPTKRELFLAAVDRGLTELCDAIDAIVEDPARDPLEQFRAAVHEYLAFFARRPELVELFIQERAEFRDHHTPLYFDTQDEKHKDERNLAFVRNLISQGRLRALVPEQFLAVVEDLLYGTIMSNHLSGRIPNPATQAEAILDILFHGVLTDAERSRQHAHPSEEPGA